MKLFGVIGWEEWLQGILVGVILIALLVAYHYLSKLLDWLWGKLTGLFKDDK